MNLDQLYEKFELRSRKGPGGKQFKYVPSADVIDRMNKVFVGRWTSEVLHVEVVEDQVVVRVRVTVLEDKEFIYHEGFGSSNIARFNSGQNEGKIIDIGNAYKAAESMAIRNACTRFGVGLYLEDEGTGTEYIYKPQAENSVPAMPQHKESGNMPQTINTHMPVPPSPADARPTSYAELKNNKPESQNTPASQTVPSSELSNMPKFPGVVGVPGGQSTNMPKPSVRPSPPIPPSTPSNTASNVVTNNIVQNQAQEQLATDVQKAALEGILSIQNADYETLVRDAFEANGLDTSTIPAIDALTYKQAVILVKHGNILFRKQ